MFASRTSHKRRRSSARGDASRANAAVPRAIITVAGSSKVKPGEPEASWAWKRLERVVASHCINHCLQVLVPVCSSEPASALIKALPSSSIGCLARVPLSLFLDPIFITSHIKRGSLVALSKDKLDTDDVVCLDGQGVLHLSVTRDTYQSLGIVGQALKQSRTSSGKGRDRLSGNMERWMVRIDILAPSFVPGKPGYDRTLARLQEWDQRRRGGTYDDQGCWDMLFSWTEHPQSNNAAQIHFPPRHVKPADVSHFRIQPHITTLDDCWIPSPSQQWGKGWNDGHGSEGRSEWSLWNEELESLSEWAALASLSAGCVRTFSRSDHLNGYQVGTQETRRPASLVKIQYRGLLSSELCVSVMKLVQEHLRSAQTEEHADFAWISCSGFNDSPLAWRMEPLVSSPGKNVVAPLDDSSSSSEESEGEEEDEGGFSSDDNLPSIIDHRLQTGPKARKRRQKKRAKRGTISRDQVGHQVKLPGSSNCNGWQVLLLAPSQDQQAEYVSVENVGGCSRC